MGILRDNPIIWREAVPKRLRRASPLARLFLGVAAVLVPFLAAAAWSVRAREYAYVLAYVLAFTWAGATVVLALTQNSRSIVQERIQGTWDMLVLSRLRPAEIVLGKLLAALLPLWAVGFIILPTCLLLVLVSDPPQPLWYVICAYGIATVGASSFGGLALYCSMRVSSVGGAQVLAFSLSWLTGVLTNLAVSGLVLLLGADEVAVFVLGGVTLLLPGFVALLHLTHSFTGLDAAHRGSKEREMRRRQLSAEGGPG
jgi:ABC-type transport system involved in multi-copper enzyme maturation permease subunit